MFKNLSRKRLLDLALLLAALFCVAELLFFLINHSPEQNRSTTTYLELISALLGFALVALLLVYRSGYKQISAVGIALDHAANLSGVGYLHYFPQQGRWVANHVAQALLRRSTPEFNATLVEILQRVHPDDREAAAATAESALRGGDSVSGRVRIGDSVYGYTLISYHAYKLQDDSLSISLVDIDPEHEARRLAERTDGRLQDALKAARATRFEIDLDSLQIVAPAAAREAIGLEPAGGLLDLINCVDLEYRDDLQLRFEQRQAFENLYPVTTQDGAKRWLRFTASVEARSRLNLTLVDLTEHKEVEFEQRNSLSQIQAASRVAKLSIYKEETETGILVPIYQDPQQKFDFCGGEQRLLRIPAQYHALLSVALESIGEVVEFPYLADNGSEVWLRYSVIAVDAHSTPPTQTVIIQDITGLAAQRRELQDSLHEMEKVRGQLQNRAERERQMFAVIGHELRTPAANIKMLLDELELDQASEHAQTLADQADHLLDVLDDVRILVSPDRVYKTQESIMALRPILERATLALQPLTLDSRLEVSLAADEGAERLYRLNPQLLRQLTLNLIRNACFHADASLLRITLRTREIDDLSTRVMLSFADNGKGVPESFKGQLFQPFHRADNESQGMGLGLSICETLVKKLNGSIRYEDTPGGGATFVAEFELTPVAQADDQIEADDSAQVAEAEQINWQGLRILFAEDNATLRLLTQKMLTVKGASVVAAEDGQLALAQFDRGTFNLVVTDIFMPNVDGYEFVAELRKRGFDGPVVGISAAVVGEETDKLIESGADAVMSKPINMGEFEQLLKAEAERIQYFDGSAGET